MSAKVFVAGGTGVLGRRVVPLLVAAGHQVTVNTRNDVAADAVRRARATPVTVDLFDAAAVATAVEGHEVVVNVATAIPTGASAARKSNWATNDRLRSEAAAHLASATPAGGRYIGESITFPYADRAAGWIDEAVPRDYSTATESVAAAEAAAQDAGGVALRFAMFWAADSAHNGDFLSAARRGIFALPGSPDAYLSWIHIDDAAAAVVAAIDAPPGIYNVAEPEPAPRAEHMNAVAKALGRKRLRGLPNLFVKIGGPPVEAMARSQRISSEALAAVSDWQPRHRIVDLWASGSVRA